MTGPSLSSDALGPTAPADDDPAPLVAGTLVDDAFRVERRLGAGGMGTVYLARDVRLGRAVALKLHGTALVAAAERALREAKVLARLSHPNVVAVYGAGTHDGRVYLAMEYVDGGTLTRWLEERPRGWRETVTMLARAGRGLAAAHAAGLVHRDVKPDNVLVGRDGRVLVADFGLARAADGDEPVSAPREGRGGEPLPAGVTAASTLLGTPAYMSPEQRRGQALDGRSDVYSFCLMLREVLAGKGPPARLQRIVARGLADEPAARWPTMTALVAALDATLRRRRRVAVVVAATAALAAAAVVPLAVARRSAARCTGGAARLAEVWTDGRAARLRAALTSGGLDAAVASSVIDRLAAFAGGWARAERAACEAGDGPTPRQREARSLCLEAARAQLAAAADLLEREPAAAPRAPDVAAALPSLALCADVRAQSALVLPPGGEAGAALDLLRKDLAAAGARFAGGLRLEGYADATALPARARALGYPPALAEALLVSAEYHADRDEAPAALAQFTEAVRVGLASGADTTALIAAQSIAWELGTGEQGDSALAWFEVTRGLAARLGQADEREGRIAGDQAVVLRNLGRLTEAEAMARRALALALEHEGERSPAYAASHGNLGLILADQGRYADGIVMLERAVALREAGVGLDHPDTWDAMLTLADARYRADRYDDALAVVRELRDRVLRRHGPDDHRLAPVLQTEGGILLAQGDVDSALAATQRALDLSARAPTPDPAWRGGLLGNMALTRAGTGDLPAAIDLARRSLAEFRIAHPDDHPDLVPPHQILGTMLRMAGELDGSEAMLREALAIAERTEPFDGPDRINTHVELAMTELARGRAAAAADRLDAVLPVLARPGGAPMNLAEARFALARAWWEAGRDRRRARELAEQARAGYAALGPGFTDAAAEVAAWLARHR